MLLALHVVGVAYGPVRSRTLLVPCVEPRLEPEIVTEVPTAPDVGDKLATTGAAGPTISS